MSDKYHEPVNELSEETREKHRAIQSAIEELEAIDWYQQRIDATKNEKLKEILQHNADEEKEHFAMTIEWLRKKDKKFEDELKDNLFKD